MPESGEEGELTRKDTGLYRKEWDILAGLTAKHCGIYANLWDLFWPENTMEHTSKSKTELKYTAITSCASTACQKSGVMEGKYTKIAQIFHQVMYAQPQTN